MHTHTHTNTTMLYTTIYHTPSHMHMYVYIGRIKAESLNRERERNERMRVRTAHMHVRTHTTATTTTTMPSLPGTIGELHQLRANIIHSGDVRRPSSTQCARLFCAYPAESRHSCDCYIVKGLQRPSTDPEQATGFNNGAHTHMLRRRRALY